MVLLTFTLSEGGVGALHDVLACISKFSDDVVLEARKEKLVLTALNISKSAYACFTFAHNKFFSRYAFTGNAQYRDRFFCKLYVRSLLSIFRSRVSADPQREKERETLIERCDVAIEDGPGVKSRFVARIVNRNGITATHRLPFEMQPPTHAKFDAKESVHSWTIAPRTLRKLMDHFGPRTELLDINTEGDNVVNFTCFAEKAINMKKEDPLKKPLHTSIAVETDEFIDLDLEEKLHIIISVKDFRAILQHADVTSSEVAAAYSTPGRPMKISYQGDAILCEFILMTVGERGAPGKKTKKGRARSVGLDSASRRGSSVMRAPSITNEPNQHQRQHQQAPQQNQSANNMAPPNASARTERSGFSIRPQPMPPPSAAKSQSLFIDQDDDEAWEPVNPEEEADDGDNARLEWDANNQANASTMRITQQDYQQSDQAAMEVDSALPAGLEPTQRISDVRRFGLFGS